jgi:hypothetical protein
VSGRAAAAGAVLVAAIGTAVVVAATAPSPRDVFRADEGGRRELYAAVAGAEPRFRARAADGFPGDLWSQDDDFHNAEQRLASELAARHGVRVADVLRAIDDGMRARWPAAAPPPQATVPPCHPRPDY